MRISMDALNPPFVASLATERPAYDVTVGDGDPAVSLRGEIRGPAVPCRFDAVAHCPDAIVTSATRFVVTLEMGLDTTGALGALELELIETLSPARVPEDELGDELRRASDPALAQRWIDLAVQAAWLAVQSDWRYGTACTLRIDRGRARLCGLVAAWDRRRMDKLVAVMTALSTAPGRATRPSSPRLAPEAIA
jgi:hypothetical protein